MKFTSAAFASFLLAAGSAAAFVPRAPSTFVTERVSSVQLPTVVVSHSTGCLCSACVAARHPVSCSCATCGRRTALFSTTQEEEPTVEVPPQVEVLDGVQGEEELHNVERPARKALKKKGPKGKPLTEFNVGDTVKAKVKSITNYGAFMDIGATTDGLLHISQLSVDFVKNVNDVLEIGQDVDVRITNIDAAKNQVGLSLLTAAQEEQAKEASSSSNRKRPERSERRDDRAALTQLTKKGWNPEQFVEGTVVSTVDFGAFVRIDTSQLNPECEGEMDGLVHISALTAGRADSVTSIVNVGDKVNVRVKAISDNKVSLTMVSVEDEKNVQAQSNSAPMGNGAADWKESLEKMQNIMPGFKNRPLVVDLRK